MSGFRASLRIARVAVDLELLPARGRGLGSDSDDLFAGAHGPGGDVVVVASRLGLFTGNESGLVLDGLSGSRQGVERSRTSGFMGCMLFEV